MDHAIHKFSCQLFVHYFTSLIKIKHGYYAVGFPEGCKGQGEDSTNFLRILPSPPLKNVFFLKVLMIALHTVIEVISVTS